MTSSEFVEAVRERLQIGDRQVRFDPHSRFDDSWDTVYIHYWNLPHGIGGAGGGALCGSKARLHGRWLRFPSPGPPVF